MNSDIFEPLQVYNVYKYLGFECILNTALVYYLRHPISKEEVYVEKHENLRTDFMGEQLMNIQLPPTLFESLYTRLPVSTQEPKCLNTIK